MNGFEKINEWIRGTETSFVNLISAIAPWLAPVAPAYMTFEHAVGTLNFPLWVAVPVAIVVEILGFSAVSTLMTFLFFNRRNRANAKKAPTEWVLFAFAFYLALILTSNVVLDASHNSENAIIVVKALYTLQTIPAATIVLARVGHKQLIAELASERAANRANEQANEQTNRSQVNEQETNDSRTFANLTRTEKYFIFNNKSELAAKELKVTPRAIQKWRKRIQDEIAQGKL
jgi:hypothetical protein